MRVPLGVLRQNKNISKYLPCAFWLGEKSCHPVISKQGIGSCHDTPHHIFFHFLFRPLDKNETILSAVKSIPFQANRGLSQWKRKTPQGVRIPSPPCFILTHTHTETHTDTRSQACAAAGIPELVPARRDGPSPVEPGGCHPSYWPKGFCWYLLRMAFRGYWTLWDWTLGSFLWKARFLEKHKLRNPQKIVGIDPGG